MTIIAVVVIIIVITIIVVESHGRSSKNNSQACQSLIGSSKISDPSRECLKQRVINISGSICGPP